MQLNSLKFLSNISNV